MNLISKNNFKLFFLEDKNLLKILIIYSVFCAFIVGNSWDLNSHILLGKSTLNYLLSFGIIDNDNYTHYRKFYSPSYWTIVYFFTQLFPQKYSLLIFKLFNLLIGWMALIGFYKLNKKFFNKEIAQFSFLFLYFHPIFFGHLAINPKDIVLAASHIWIFYLILEYLDKQNYKFNSFKIILKLSFFLALGTGVQLYFAASLMPIFFFVLIEIFLIKKITNNNFQLKKFIFDFLKVFILFYFLLIFFWIDSHSNIFVKPFELFLDSFSTYRGWPGNLVNGKIFYSDNASIFYVPLLTFYKSPEYILLLSVFFLIFYHFIYHYFKKKINFFSYKTSVIFLILLFPIFILFINPFPVYDGLRLFLWYIPYTVIFPALSLNYLFINLRLFFNKFIFGISICLIIYHLISFFSYTPYQYTYLNIFSGPIIKKDINFENDYWGVTLKELIKKIKNDYEPLKGDKIKKKVYTCAIPVWIVKDAIKKYNLENTELTSVIEEANFIILTNRTIVNYSPKKNILLCKDYLKKEILSVKRFGHKLSIFGEINKNF